MEITCNISSQPKNLHFLFNGLFSDFKMNSRILSNLMHKSISHHYKLKVLKNAAYTLHLSQKYSVQSPQAEELVVKEKIQVTRPSVIKWKRPPFVKSLFFGRFDTVSEFKNLNFNYYLYISFLYFLR